MDGQTVTRRRILVAGVVAGVAAFAVVFLLADQAYFRFADARFPHVGDSVWLATLWGVVSRLHVIVPVIVVALWRPRFLGLRIGTTRSHWRMLAAMLLVNCGVVAAFLLITGAAPYGGNQWLLTEVITVPVVEELLWRGVILSVVLVLLKRLSPGRTAAHVAVWSTGIAFGVLHLGNLAAGVPLAFVLPQAAAAVAWGVMYGYARTSTDSVLPPIALHAAMNLVVVLLG